MSFEVYVIYMVVNLITLIVASIIMYKVNGNSKLYYYHSPNWVFIALTVCNILIPLAFILNVFLIISFGWQLIGFDSNWFNRIPGRKE